MLLGNREVDVDRVQRLQDGDGRPRVQILTQVDRPDAQLAAEGRPDRFLPDLRLERPGVGAHRLELGLICIELGLGRGAARFQLARPRRRSRGEIAPRLQRRQLRPFDAGVQLDQDLARAHLRPRIEADGADQAGDLVADRDPAASRDAAHRLQQGLPLSPLRHRGSHRFRRRTGRLRRLSEADQGRDLSDLSACQQADHDE